MPEGSRQIDYSARDLMQDGFHRSRGLGAPGTLRLSFLCLSALKSMGAKEAVKRHEEFASQLDGVCAAFSGNQHESPLHALTPKILCQVSKSLHKCPKVSKNDSPNAALEPEMHLKSQRWLRLFDLPPGRCSQLLRVL